MSMFDHRDIAQIDKIIDDLQRGKIVKTICNDLRSNTPPKVLGIYGWWGSGKSHLLSLIIKEILATNSTWDEQVIVIPYNPWHYELEGDLAPGLIKSLLEVEQKLKGKNPSFTLSDEARKKGNKILDILAQVSELVPGYGKLISVITSSIKTTLDKTENPKSEGPIIDQVEAEMQGLVAEIIKSAKKVGKSNSYRLVVFIDDLDRCSPKNMVRLFEWMKVHLSVPGISYVMALDHIAAARAIVGEYRTYLDKEDDLAYGFRYLEKLIETEYELSVAQFAQSMAVRKVFGAESYDGLLSNYTVNHILQADFPGIELFNKLLEFRSLKTPRTMLKIVDKFGKAMQAILESEQIKNDLPDSYPFWALFMIGMYYTLDPTFLDDLIRGRGVIYAALTGGKPSQTNSVVLREFIELTQDIPVRSTMTMPNHDKMFFLATVIRENSVSGLNSL